MIKNGDLVVVKEATGKYGKVVESFSGWRLGKTESLHHVHFIDSGTGQLMQCPDNRCHGEHTCPIHGGNYYADQLDLLPSIDVEFFVQEGILARELVPQ